MHVSVRIAEPARGDRQVCTDLRGGSSADQGES
jgi:hypothetical protein